MTTLNAIIILLVSSYLANAQGVVMSRLTSWKDARLVQSYCVNARLCNVYDNGCLIEFDPTTSKVSEVSLPDGKLAAQVLEHNGSMWVRMLSGHLYSRDTTAAWRMELDGIEGMYQDGKGTLYVLDSNGVSRITSQSSIVQRQLIRSVPKKYQGSAFIVRGDTVVLSLSDDTKAVILYDNGEYTSRSMYFTQAYSLSDGLIIAARRNAILQIGSMAKDDSLDIQRNTTWFKDVTLSHGVDETGTGVSSFTGIDISSNYRVVYGFIRDGGIQQLPALDSRSQIVSALTAVAGVFVTTYRTSTFGVIKDSIHPEYVSDGDLAMLTVGIIPFVTPDGLKALAQTISIDSNPSKSPVFVRSLNDMVIRQLGDTASSSHESAVRLGNGSEIVISRPQIFQALPQGSFKRVSSAMFAYGLPTNALPHLVDDSTILVHSVSNRYVLSTNGGATWSNHVLRSLRSFPVSVHQTDSLIVFGCMSEVAIVKPRDLKNDTIDCLWYYPQNPVPLCVAGVSDTHVDVIVGQAPPDRVVTEIKKLWHVTFQGGNKDSVALELPYPLSASSIVRCSMVGDTLLVFSLSGGRNTAQLSTFVNGKLASHRFIPTASFAPLNTLMNTSVRFIDKKTIELTRIDQGLQATIDLSEDEVSSVETSTHEPHGKMYVYPNPASTSITISLPEEFASQEGVNVDIYDALSVHCIHTTLQVQQAPYNTTRSLHLDISSLQSGAYIVRARSHAGVMSTTLVVRR